MNDTIAKTAHPPIATEAEWLKARKELLAEEKALTVEYDRIAAKRRRLPMVKVEKDYTFTGEDGEKSLLDLFDGKIQLILYHFMFAPEWENGCSGCTSFANALGDLSGLGKRDTNMVMVSRAPIEKLTAYKEKHGWTLPWYSSGDSDFNYDFDVTIDPSRNPEPSYNYKTVEELAKQFGEIKEPVEMPGTSVFFRIGDDIYHTYSTFARGGEKITDSYMLLDLTPYGRQEDFEDSPDGWPQHPTYG